MNVKKEREERGDGRGGRKGGEEKKKMKGRDKNETLSNVSLVFLDLNWIYYIRIKGGAANYYLRYCRF
jgi:hypothetical protein